VHGDDVAISPADGLLAFRVKISAGQQVGEVSVHGWDAKAKREIVATAKPPAGDAGEGPKQHGGSASLAVASHAHPVDVSTAEEIAKGRLRKLAERFVVAQGKMIGDPRVVPGAVLQLDQISYGLDGGYRVDRARHEYSRHGYFVEFRCVRVSKKKPAAPAVAPVQEQKPPPEQPPPNPARLQASVAAEADSPRVDAGIETEIAEERVGAAVESVAPEERVDASISSADAGGGSAGESDRSA
jgi:hypothetical protein